MFLIYVNDISQSIQNSDCRLYADDTILCSEVINDAKSLQDDINELKSWADKWGMIFNHKKCVHVKVGSDQPDISLKLGDNVIPHSDSVKYLGVTNHSNLKWNAHFSLFALCTFSNRVNDSPSLLHSIYYIECSKEGESFTRSHKTRTQRGPG